jgi:hypothetical protein
MIKGSTSDFVPAKEFFHVAPADAANIERVTSCRRPRPR